MAQVPDNPVRGEVDDVDAAAVRRHPELAVAGVGDAGHPGIRQRGIRSVGQQQPLDTRGVGLDPATAVLGRAEPDLAGRVLIESQHVAAMQAGA